MTKQERDEAAGLLQNILQASIEKVPELVRLSERLDKARAENTMPHFTQREAILGAHSTCTVLGILKGIQDGVIQIVTVDKDG